MSSFAARRATSARDALDSAIGALAAGGCETPRLDAELLLAHAIGCEREALVREPDQPLPGPAIRTFQSAVRRRAIEREPVAYILGRRAFRYLDLSVDARVLIPRPETELLVEVGLELPDGSSVLDLGTGCGAVALALKQERPQLTVTGSDVSKDALEVAAGNARRLDLDVDLIEADLLGDAATWARRFDAILSNPPYVDELEQPRLAPEIVRHEPAQALMGGRDGLEVMRALVDQAGRAGTGLLALEVGADQAPVVEGVMRQAGFGCVERRRDLAGIERVVVGRR